MVANADVPIDDFSYSHHRLTGSVAMQLVDGHISRYSASYADKCLCSAYEYRSPHLLYTDATACTDSSHRTIGVCRDVPLKCIEVLYRTGKHKIHDRAYIASNISNGTSLPVHESLASHSSMVKGVNILKDVPLKYRDALCFNAAQSIYDRAYIESNISKNHALPLYERIEASSSVNKWAKELFYESTAISDDLLRHNELNRTENAIVGDTAYKTFVTNHKDGIINGDVLLNGSAIALSESLKSGIYMYPKNIFDKLFKDSVGTSETVYKSIYERSYENVNVRSEKSSAESDIIYYERSNIRSHKADEWLIDRSFSHDCKLADAGYRSPTIREEEAISMDEWRLMPNAIGVLSDIHLTKTAMTAKDFEKISNKPSGYTAFSEFKVGEYEYKDALYRLDIQRVNAANNPIVYDYKVHVDIDDVKDRGTATIPAEETKVYFNRTYYTEPDVVVNVISGTGGDIIIPFITSTAGKDDKGRYFTVILKTRDGTPVKGKISWNSNGY